MRGRDDPGRRSLGTRALERIRAVSVWSVFVAAVMFGIAFGLQWWVIVVGVFGLVWAGISRAVSDRVAERFERRPELALEVSVGEGQWGDSPLPARQPWPFDADAIVEAETRRLAEAGDAFERMAKGPGGIVLRGALSTPPSASAYERARRTFDGQVSEYADALRQWLSDYRDRADQLARTFELDLRVTAGRRGAYAEDVSLKLSIPTGVEIVRAKPTICPPPDAPAYESPRSQPLFVTPEFVSPASIASLARIRPLDVEPATARKVSAWTIDKTGHEARASLGSVHHGSFVPVPGTVFIRAPSTGRFEITWTLFAKNSRRHATGVLALDIPELASGPAFKRLQGIMTFPDVPLVKDDGEVLLAGRTEDPPTSPPDRTDLPDATGEDALIVHLRERRRLLEWQCLGIGENEDDAPAPGESDE
jgi:hypothetical protein